MSSDGGDHQNSVFAPSSISAENKRRAPVTLSQACCTPLSLQYNRSLGYLLTRSLHSQNIAKKRPWSGLQSISPRTRKQILS